MNTDVSTALATLKSDPENSKALEVLATLHPGNGSGVDSETLGASLAAARAWHEQHGDVHLCVQLLDIELTWTPGGRHRADLLVEKGRLLHQELLRWDPARVALKEALEIVPVHPGAAEILRAMEAEEAGWEKQLEANIQRAKGTGNRASAAPALASAGELYLKFRPKMDEGERNLRRALELDPRHKRADVLLERVLRHSGRTEQLMEHFQRRISVATSAEDKAAAEVAAGTLADQLGRADDALEHFRRALAADPTESRALHWTVRALSAEGRWSDVVKVYESALRAAKRGAEQAILVPLATVCWHQLHDLDQAELYFRRVRKAQPVSPEVIAFYREYHTKRGEIPQLLALLAQAQKAESDTETRIKYGIEMAQIAEQRPQSLEKAIDAWKALLRMRPGLPEAVVALRRLYTRTEKWNALLELLKDELETLPPEAVDQKVERYLEMIPIYRDRLKLDVMVINTFVAVLALRPDHPDALAALADRYEAQGRWGDLIQVLSRQAEATADVNRKVALYHRVAGLWGDKFNKHQNAVAALEKVLLIAPGDARSRTALREIYLRSRSWRALLDLMRREVALVPADRTRAHLAEMAKLAAEKVSDAKGAIALWNEVLAVSTDDSEALTSLAVLYEREKRWPALAEVLGRQATLTPAKSQAWCALLEKRGMLLHEKLGASQAALEVLRQVQSASPDNARLMRVLREIYAQLGELAALETMYAERGAFDELCDVLSTLADRNNDVAMRTRLLERVAELATSKLNQPERALKAYEKILTTDSDNRTAARAAAAIYRSTERWGRLLATYEILLGTNAAAQAAVLPLDERLSILEEARRISEQKLSSKALAFQWCARAFEVAPTDPAVVADLERLGEEADEWPALAALLAKRLDSTEDREEQLTLLRKSLRIAVLRLGSVADARRHAERILTLKPNDEEAEGALQQLLTRGESWSDLVSLLHQRQARTEDRVARLEMLHRIARTEEEKMGDRAAAARTLREALSLEPENLRTVRALAKLHEGLADWPGLAEMLRKLVELAPEDERADTLLRLARLEESELGQPAAAQSSYLRALEADPVSAEAVAGLERLLAAGAVAKGDARLIAGRLAPYYELTESYEKWARALETLAETADDHGERMAHLELLTDLFAGPLADQPSAYRCAVRMFELEPLNFSIRERMLQLAGDAGTLDDLLGVLRRRLEKNEDAGLRREMLVHIAEIEERRSPQHKETETAYAEVLRLDPLHFGAYRALMRLYRDNERWGELRDLLETRQAALPETKERVEILSQVAEIDEALLDDRDHAVATLRRLLELDPSDLRAYRSLERHYATDGRWRDLDELLVRILPLVPSQERAEVSLRRADLVFTRFEDAGTALDLLDDVLVAIPEHPQARALLERIVEVPAGRQRAALMLEPIYESTGQWGRLVTVLDVQRETADPGAALDLLVRTAEIQESKLAARTDALQSWREVLELDPRSARALTEVERLATMLERFDDLVELYQELATRRGGADLSGAAELLGRGARLHLTRFNDRAAAIAAWRQVMALDPGNVDIAGPAADALEALYSEATDSRGLVEILRAKAEWAGEGAARRDYLLRVASIEERLLGEPEAAIATYRAIVEVDPENGEALGHLERIFEAGGRHRDRVAVLERRVEGTTDLGLRRDLRFRIANILELELEDLDASIGAVRAILDETPEDRGALETLSRLYKRKGSTGERLEILERQLAVTTGAAERVEILRQTAELLEGPLGRAADGFERWREILTIAPRDPGALAQLERLLDHGDVALRTAAAQTLEPIYESAGDWERLARVIRIFIDADEDPRARMAHRTRLAAVAEDRLGDPAAAFDSYGAAIRDALGERQLPQLLDAYERLAAVMGAERVRDVLTLYREVEEDVLGEEVRVRMQRTIAQDAVLIGDLPLAADYYRRVLERLPDDLDVLGALERIYRQTDEAQPLYDTLLHKAEIVANDPAQELPLRLEAGALAVRLDKNDEAIVAYERVWTLKPGEPTAGTRLEELYAATRQSAELAGLLERRLALGMTDRDAVALRYRLGQIERKDLGNRERALQHLAAVLAGDPDHVETIATLEELLADADAKVEAAHLLEPVYVRRNAWARLVDIDKIRLEHTEDPTQRLAWTQRIARIYEEQIEDLDEAFRWYGKVFQETPTDRAAYEQVLRLAPKLDKWKDAAALLDEYLEGELGNGDEVLTVVRLAAEVYDDKLGDRDTARKYYHRFIEAQPGDRAASAVFEQALERWESWEELRDHLEEQATRVESVDGRVALLHRSARLSEEKLTDRTAAITTLRAVLDADPSDVRAAAGLERLLGEEERWSDLRDHLVWILERETEKHAQDTLALKIAGIEQHKLEDAGAALDRYAEVLGRTPAHPAALAALEGLLSHEDHRHRTAEILEPLYRSVGNWQKLVDVLEIRLVGTGDPAQRITTLREMADFEERLGRFDRALEARGRAWLEDVGSPETLHELEAVATSTKRFTRLVEILEQGAADAGNPDVRGGLHALRARVLETRLGDAAHAVEAWREALEARSDDIEAFLALERLLAAASRSAELCETIEKHVDIVTDPEERKLLTKRVAMLYEQALHDRERAIGAWRSVLELDDGDDEALDALGRLYVAENAWQSLAEIYQRKIELAKEPQGLRLLRFMSARLHDEKLAEPFEAASQLRSVLDTHPGDGEALEFLDHIFAREGQHAELLEILDLRARGEKDPAQRDAFAFRAGRLLELDMSDLQGAVDRYREILQHSPRHTGARDAVWALARSEENRLLAVPVLEPVLRAEKEWEPLIELLELRLAAEEALGPRLEILAEIARLEEQERRDPGKAFTAWARAFTEDPTEEQAREALERLAVAEGQLPELARVYEDRFRNSYDAELQRSLASRLAELYEGALADPTRAVEFWREALNGPGDETVPLTHLERLLRELGRDAELEEILQREADAAPEPAAQADFLAALGQVRLEKLGEIEGGIEAFRAALDRVPTHPLALAALRGFLGKPNLRASVLDILEPLAEARADHPELLALYEARVSLEDEPSERAMWLRRIAETAETKLGDIPRAIDALGRALKEDPLAFQTADDLERVAAAGGAGVEAARRIEAVLDAVEDAAFSEMALRSAKLYASAGGAEHEAVAQKIFGRVLESDPENSAALEALEALHRRRGDMADLASVLVRRGALELDPERRTGFLGEAARLHEQRGDTAAAIEAWRSVREGDEGNLVALSELSRLYEIEGKTTELVEILEEKARFLDDSGQRASVYVQIGQLKSEKLADRDGAAAAYREALDIAPEDETALGALAAIEEQRGDYSALEEALLRQLTAAKGQRQVAVLGKLADNAATRLDDPDRAMSYLHQILDKDPENRAAFGELERLLTSLERWHDLIELLERRAELEKKAGNAGEELVCRVKIAETWGSRLGAPDNAMEALERILATDPRHVPSLIALARIHEAEERWDEAAAALARAAGAGPSPKDAAEIHFGMARVGAAQGGAPNEIEGHYFAALDSDPSHAGALKALEAIARETGNTGKLVQLLELRERVSSDDNGRRALLSEIASLYLGPLEAPAEAIMPLQELVALAPTDLTVQENLGRALAAAGRVQEGEAILTALVDQMAKAKQPKNVARLQQILGALAEQREDWALADQRLSAAYQLDPTQASTLAALGRLALRQNDTEKARRFYRSLLLHTFDEKSVGITKAEVYLALGRLHEQAGEVSKARNMYERGLECEPRNDTIKTVLANLPRS